MKQAPSSLKEDNARMTVRNAGMYGWLRHRDKEMIDYGKV